jgi:hypothetical protein
MRGNEPVLDEAGRLCAEAYATLDSERPTVVVPLGLGGAVMTTGRVPWRAVERWCTWRGLGQRETAIVAEVVRRLDRDHMQRERERIQAAAKG